MKTKNTSPKTAGSNKDKEPSLALKKPVSIGNYEELKMKNDAIITGEQQKITAGEHNNIEVKDRNIIAADNHNKIQVGHFNFIAADSHNSINGEDINSIAIGLFCKINVDTFNYVVACSLNHFKANKNNTIACKFDNAIELTGTGNMVMAANGSKFRGKTGNAICMVEFDDKKRKILNTKAAIIDGEILKEDVFYTYKSGEFIETN